MEQVNVPSFFEFHLPTKIQFGAGLATDLAETLSRYGHKIFVLTDQNLVRFGLLTPILESLQGKLEVVCVFEDIPPNSEVKTVQAAYQSLLKHPADMLLAIGGGSVMDTAKAVNILKHYGGDLLDYQGVGILEDPLGPLICIPTTAGTGSEVTKYAVIKDNETHQKVVFVSPSLCPHLAVLDPELLRSLPKGMTAASGMDALTHAIEAIVANQSNFISEALAFQVIRLVHQHLKASVENGNDLAHRSAMLIASTLGGMAFNDAGVGIIHAMAHPLGGHSNIPHGMANSIMLPYGIQFNRKMMRHKYVQIGELVGIRELDPEKAVDLLLEYVRRLAKECGLPSTLKEAGLLDPSFEILAEEASCDGSIYTNPCEATIEELQALYEEAYRGR